ncbi:MAG: MOSC N-terminal beta barrel domain-containing protein [Planctomycetaceae bacterium]
MGFRRKCHAEAENSSGKSGVKSMMGEELNGAYVTECGLRGDRAYALVDPSNGKVVSAKNPRK